MMNATQESIRTGVFALLGLGALGLVLSGCATEQYVNERIAPLDKRLTALEATSSEQNTRIEKLASEARATQATVEGVESRVKNLEAQKIFKQVSLSSNATRFKAGAWRLSKEAKAEIDRLAQEIADINYSAIVVSGHTDSVGSAALNLSLGRKRAEAVSAYLASLKGIDRNRITVLTYGKTLPLADNKSKAGRAENRRVEITVYETILK